MATPVVMPRLGMVMSEGTVTRWTRAKGEAVAKGEVIAEIETEKISYALEATADGIVHPLVEEGATLPVDGLMGYLLAAGEAVPEPDTAKSRIEAGRRDAHAAPRDAGHRGGPPRRPRADPSPRPRARESSPPGWGWT